MSMHKQELLARKYAAAFCNVFGAKLSAQEVARFYDAYTFLHTHHKTVFFLRLPMLSDVIKRTVLDQLFKRFELHQSIHELLRVLLQEKRAGLLPFVLREIHERYNKMARVSRFVITSSHPLDAHAQKEIHTFLVNKTKSTLQTDFIVSPALIMGIRMQSDTMLWERSIAQQLTAFKRARFY